MRLADLCTYAQEKYGIREEHKWARFPGFSVLTDPSTGKWAALLMRRRQNGIGAVVETADLKCGRNDLPEDAYPYLFQPFRMKGNDWVGVVFNEDTDEETVYRLFDRSLKDPQKTGFTVHRTENDGFTIVRNQKAEKEVHVSDPCPQGSQARSYTETALNFHSENGGNEIPELPEKIRQMYRLYHYGKGTFAEKRKNFVRQARFMEDYEDDKPWDGYLKRYFPVYHDLTPRQLRGYFTWRTDLRHDKWKETCTAFVYICLYELINGIGAASIEKRISKLQDFDQRYPGEGKERESIHRNIEQWIQDLCIVHCLPTEKILPYMNPEIIRKENAVSVLINPENQEEEEIFNALNTVYKKDLNRSPVIKKHPEEGKHLFVQIWKQVLDRSRKEGKDLAASCFGKMTAFAWQPLGNAVYEETEVPEGSICVLNSVHSYRYQNGRWKEHCLGQAGTVPHLFDDLMHASDRLIRKYLHCGSSLKPAVSEASLEPYILEVLANDRKEKEDAAKPKVEIHFSALDQIRADAAKTRESLLTEEEVDEEKEDTPEPVETEKEEALAVKEEEPESESSNLHLDPLALQVVRNLLKGEDVKDLIRKNHAMAEILADQINEAFYEEIGDGVVESDGETMTLIDDYREDVKNILEGEENE